MKNPFVFPALIIGITLIIVAGIIKHNSSKKQSSPTASTTPVTTRSSVPSNCLPVRYGLRQPPMEALFLREPTPNHLEGIISKRSSGGQSTFSLTTNRLPQKNGDYYLWIIDVDKNGNVCKSDNIGQLVQNTQYGKPDYGTWTISFDKSRYSDDSMIVVITNNSYGKLPSEDLRTPGNPNIILSGSFSQSDRVREINTSPSAVSNP